MASRADATLVAAFGATSAAAASLDHSRASRQRSIRSEVHSITLAVTCNPSAAARAHNAGANARATRPRDTADSATTSIGIRLMAPAKAAGGAASHLHGVPRTKGMPTSPCQRCSAASSYAASTRTCGGAAPLRFACSSARASSEGSSASRLGLSAENAVPSGRATNPALSSLAHHRQPLCGRARSHSATIRLIPRTLPAIRVTSPRETTATRTRPSACWLEAAR